MASRAEQKAAARSYPADPPHRPQTGISPRALRNTMRGLALIGLGIATYLTIVHYGGFTVLCTSKNNACAQVQASIYSHVAGVPVALLGLIGYLGILFTLFVRENEAARLGTLAIALFGFGFSLYLTYREVFTLKEICEWCVTSAGLMTALFGLALYRYLRTPPLPSQPPVSPR
jgi:uncharacterized membrane protein